MDEKILELLKTLHEDMASLKANVKSLQEGQTRIETKIDNLDNKVSEFEPLNAKRHIEIADKIDKLSADLNVVEAISGKNLTDIAILKMVK